MDRENIPPTVVLKISPKTGNEAREWLKQRIHADKAEGGCQLNVHQDNELLYLNASKKRLLQGAELIGIKKEYKDGTMREFSYADGISYKNFHDDDFLLENEVHQIIKAEFDDLRATVEKHIPGHPDIRLYPGKSIYRRMKRHGMITDCYPLHNRRALFDLKNQWYKNVSVSFSVSEPIDAIREYFGYPVGIYFAFLNFYTVGLIPLAIASIYYVIKEAFGGVTIHNWGLSVVNIIWSALLLVLWKRKFKVYTYKWGYLGAKGWENPRPGFHGRLGINPITNRHEPVYPIWKRYLKYICVSIPVTALSLLLSISMMFAYFRWEKYMTDVYDDRSFYGFSMRNLPSIIYSVMMLSSDVMYRRLAKYLTDFENHRLESSFQNHLIFKILLLTFTNNFLCLFYIAFVYENVAMLRVTLRNLLVVHMIISQANEALLPYWLYRAHSSIYRVKLSRARGVSTSAILSDKITLSREEHARLELHKQTYDGTFDDYLELWLQFGYVILFSCVYPPAAIFAFINNLIEEKSDAFKICNVYRRPFTYHPSSVNVWQFAFTFLSYLSIVSNLALLFRSESFLARLRGSDKPAVTSQPPLTDAYIVFLFFVAEHVLLILRWLASVVIPDVPRWLKTDLAKIQFRSIEALKQQRTSATMQPSVSTR